MVVGVVVGVVVAIFIKKGVILIKSGVEVFERVFKSEKRDCEK